MNCQATQDFLYSCNVDTLPLAQEGLIQHHIKHCQQCQQLHKDTQRYVAAISVSEPKQMSPWQKRRVLSVIPKEQKREYRKLSLWFGQGFVTASIIISAVIFGILAMEPSRAPSQVLAAIPLDSDSTVIASESSEQNISLMIEVPEDMSQADLALEFPDSLRWSGLEELERIEWAVDLQKGPNVLDVPVSYLQQISNTKPQFITASIRYGEKTRSFKLPVSANDKVQQTSTLLSL